VTTNIIQGYNQTRPNGPQKCVTYVSDLSETTSGDASTHFNVSYFQERETVMLCSSSAWLWPSTTLQQQQE